MSWISSIFRKNKHEEEKQPTPTKEDFMEDSDDFISAKEDFEKEVKNLNEFLKKYGSQEVMEYYFNRGYKTAEEGAGNLEEKQKGLATLFSQVNIEISIVKNVYEREISLIEIYINRAKQNLLISVEQQEQARLDLRKKELAELAAIEKDFKDEKGDIYDLIKNSYEGGFNKYISTHVFGL